MKKFKEIQILALCMIMLCTVLCSSIPTQAFSTKTAKKNVSVTYKKLSDGVLAIYKNKNKSTLTLSATVSFRDGDKQSISKIKQKNLCFTGKSTVAFFFQAPRDEYGNVINYSSYKGTFSVSKSKYKSYSKYIHVNSTLETIEGKFAAVNLGQKTLSNIHATMVFYDGNGDILGCSTKYLNCYRPNAIDQFSISYVGESYQPSKAKVYIDWAY